MKIDFVSDVSCPWCVIGLLALEQALAEVRQAESRVHRSGIHSVPAVIIDDQYLVSGGQPAEVFAQALRQVAARQG